MNRTTPGILIVLSLCAFMLLAALPTGAAAATVAHTFFEEQYKEATQSSARLSLLVSNSEEVSRNLMKVLKDMRAMRLSHPPKGEMRESETEREDIVTEQKVATEDTIGQVISNIQLLQNQELDLTGIGEPGASPIPRIKACEVTQELKMNELMARTDDTGIRASNYRAIKLVPLALA